MVSFAMRVDARLICQRGESHEGTGTLCQLHDFLHGVHNDHGDQPKALLTYKTNEGAVELFPKMLCVGH